jgi:hypothetical protein
LYDSFHSRADLIQELIFKSYLSFNFFQFQPSVRIFVKFCQNFQNTIFFREKKLQYLGVDQNLIEFIKILMPKYLKTFYNFFFFFFLKKHNQILNFFLIFN